MDEIKERFEIFEEIERDQYSTVFEAYDKIKKCYCYLELPNIKTSWQFDVTY